MDDELIVQFVEARHGTHLHAIGEFAFNAFIGNNVCHIESLRTVVRATFKPIPQVCNSFFRTVPGIGSLFALQK
jgi:hypothetical protein